jgi:3-dehydroquinate synthase
LEQRVDELNARDVATLTQIIARCCRLKADVVQRDERDETGVRAVLNYGHTFGHALEAATQYGELLHGEGVAIGMMCAARLAEKLGRIDRELIDRQAKLLSALSLPIETPDLPAETLISHMQHDKKTQQGRLRFVLPSRLGHVELVDVDDLDAVRAAL